MLRAMVMSMARRARSSAILEDSENKASRIFNKEASRMITLTAINGPKVRALKKVTRMTAECCLEDISTTASGEFRGCISSCWISGGMEARCEYGILAYRQ